jgi:hypothetical protein
LVQSKGNGGSIYATSEGAVTTDRFGSIFIDSTTSTTANITKIGSFIRSIGRWSGTNATNTGLVVEAKGDVTNLTPTIVGLSVSVDNATNKYAAIFSGGNVGIGVGTPQRLLHLSKDNNFGHVNTNTSLFRLQNANNTTCPGTVNIWDVRVGNCGQLGFITSSSNVNPNFNILKANDLIADAPGVVASINTTAPVNTFMIDADGDVGINNAAPAHKLDVGGDINISSGS